MTAATVDELLAAAVELTAHHNDADVGDRFMALINRADPKTYADFWTALAQTAKAHRKGTHTLCLHRREDGARCVLNKDHSSIHGYAYAEQVDLVKFEAKIRRDERRTVHLAFEDRTGKCVECLHSTKRHNELAYCSVGSCLCGIVQ